VLDEVTSALAEKSQDKMMEMVTPELPTATIVSVALRAELEHRRKIVLERRHGGAKLASDVALIPRKSRRRLLGSTAHQLDDHTKATRALIQGNFARLKSARSAFVACTVSIPSSAAASRTAFALRCRDQNSNHSTLLRFV
jgi:hypothetical protein